MLGGHKKRRLKSVTTTLSIYRVLHCSMSGWVKLIIEDNETIDNLFRFCYNLTTPARLQMTSLVYVHSVTLEKLWCISAPTLSIVEYKVPATFRWMVFSFNNHAVIIVLHPKFVQKCRYFPRDFPVWWCMVATYF